MTKERSGMVQELYTASKQNGPDPLINHYLAAKITAAKKLSVPKAVIEGAIARGQGRSLTGATLESLRIEAMIPPAVAIIVECQTDTKPRTMSEMKIAIRKSGGTLTPTSHVFDRKGKIVLGGSKSVGEEEIFDQAIEAGAIDIQVEDDGKVVVYAEPDRTTAVADALAISSGLKLESLDIVWEPKEDMMVDVANTENLDMFLGDSTPLLDFVRADIRFQQREFKTIRVCKRCIQM